MENELINDESSTTELPDLAISTNQAEEAKGGRADVVPTDQISVNFAKVDFK